MIKLLLLLYLILIFYLIFKSANNGDIKKSFRNSWISKNGEERISLKLTSLPIDADFQGWFSIFPPKDKSNKAIDLAIDDVEF